MVARTDLLLASTAILLGGVVGHLVSPRLVHAITCDAYTEVWELEKVGVDRADGNGDTTVEEERWAETGTVQLNYVGLGVDIDPPWADGNFVPISEAQEVGL